MTVINYASKMKELLEQNSNELNSLKSKHNINYDFTWNLNTTDFGTTIFLKDRVKIPLEIQLFYSRLFSSINSDKP